MEDSIKLWLKNNQFVDFLSKKGLDISSLLSYYRFSREDKTRIASDYALLKQYFQQFLNSK